MRKFFLDTEFLDTGREVHAISIGLVSEDGQEYYAEFDDWPRHLATPWLNEFVVPQLSGITTPREKIGQELIDFCGYAPKFWAWFGAYDWVVMCQIFGRMLDVPKTWPHHVMDIHQLQLLLGIPRQALPIQTSKGHRADDDARWNKWVYEFLTKEA